MCKKEKIYHPAHYNSTGRKECWDEMIDLFGAEMVAVFDCINAYKYWYRAGKKQGDTKQQDLKKMKNYIDHAEKIAKGAWMTDADYAIKTIKNIIEKGE